MTLKADNPVSFFCKICCSGPLWGFVVGFLLFNIKGSNLYFWIAIIPISHWCGVLEISNSRVSQYQYNKGWLCIKEYVLFTCNSLRILKRHSQKPWICCRQGRDTAC